MHVKFANLLYLSKESIFQWTHAWPDWFARTTKNKIADVRTWDDIMHVKYARVLYSSKESIFQWTHAWPERFARTSNNKIADVRTWEDIIHKVHLRYCIYLRDLYFRELTHGRTGSPDHPKENSRYMHPWDDLMHVTYAKVLCLSKESISQRTQAWPDWFSRRSKRE